MASSKGSPGIHDRKPDSPRENCIMLTHFGKRCKRFAIHPTKLCKEHRKRAEDPSYDGNHGNSRHADGPVKSPEDGSRAGLTTGAKKRAASALVLTNQARDALRKLGDPALIAQSERIDPKRVLLDQVRSAFQQAQIWEAMLASVPAEDWDMVGTPPVPGDPDSARGARIEIMQKNLAEATKSAARISKLAVDAGIEERLVRLAEEQSNLIADTVRAGVIAGIAALAKLGIISPAGEAAAIETALGSAANHLRILAATGGDKTVIDSVAVVIDKQTKNTKPKLVGASK